MELGTAPGVFELEGKEPYDVLVIGGGPAGASTAIYAARKGIRTGIVVERFGGQVRDTLGIENVIGTMGSGATAALSAFDYLIRN